MENNIKNRIIYSNDQMMVSLMASLDHMNVFRYDSQYRRCLGDAFVDKLSEWERQIRQRKEDSFTIVVIGDFKRGKSTLINALLGEEVVTCDVTTETVTMNRISYGIHSNEAVLSGSRRIQLTDRELKREALERVITGIEEPVECLELKRPCELLKNITIIDTPGTGDAMRDFNSMVRESLLQADAVIYVYNVLYPLSLSEQLFLKSTVLPQKYTSLFLVGNYTDTLVSPENYIKMRRLLQQRISNLMPDSEVFMVSALDELCRILGKNRPVTDALSETLEEQFQMLREAINNLIEQKADTVVLDRMQRLTSAMIEDLSEALDAIDQGLKMSREDAVTALEKLRKEKEDQIQKQTMLLDETDAKIDLMKRDAYRWLIEFVERIADESANLAAQSSDTIREYYEFYCIDLMQEGLTACVEYHQDQLYDYLDSISTQLSGRLAEDYSEFPSYRFFFHLDNRIWTKGDTFGLAVSMLPAHGLLSSAASLVIDGLSGTMRERETAMNTPNLIKQITGKLTNLSLSVKDTLDQIYDDLGDKCKKFIVQFYTDELESKEKLLNQAVSVSAKEDYEKSAIYDAVAHARTILGSVAKESGIDIPEVS